MLTTEESIYESVKNYYGRILQTSKDLKTSACVCASKPHHIIREIIKTIPDEIVSKFYGCGNPIPSGGIEGLNILDLGSGSGRDCYIAANLVGAQGTVTGVDMTDEQLEVARKYVDEYCVKQLNYPKPNLRFVKGYIEFLEQAGIEANSMDLVISNCVVNLSPNKKQVLKSVYQVLKKGGEFYFSDIYCDRRLPEKARNHELLFGECIAGALYIGDFKRLCRETGFEDPRILSSSPVSLDDEIKELTGEANFYSITYRLFKLDNLEPQCEDYGQIAVYRGTIPGYYHSYMLDDHHKFENGKPVLVCGNTASMLSDTWLGKHFSVLGNRIVHFGLFNCSNNTKQLVESMSNDRATASCGSCC
jgi:ubiquinone/menaquinone biosynthesis C-methylase UbiE